MRNILFLLLTLFFLCETARAQVTSAHVADGVLYERYANNDQVIEVPTSADLSVVRYAVQSDSLIAAMTAAIDSALAREAALEEAHAVLLSSNNSLQAQVTALESRNAAQQEQIAQTEEDLALYAATKAAIEGWIERLNGGQ